MKKIVFSILLILFFIFSLKEVKAGLCQFQGYVNLKPFSKEIFCGIGMYSTDMINGTYTLGYSQNILPFVKDINPNNIQLTSIDNYNAPQESEQRREFVKKICIENNTDSCVLTCTKFEGLGLKRISFDIYGPKEETIVGQVYDIVKIRESTGKEVLQFIVLYTPFDGRIIIGSILIVISVFLFSYFIYRKKRKREQI